MRPGTRYERVAGSNAGVAPIAPHNASTTPLTSKKSTGRVAADQFGTLPAPHQANATARASPAGANRAPVSKSRTSRRSRRRLYARASTSPGSSEGRRTANFSESGFASAAGSAPSANGAAACCSMNVNVVASEKPHAVRTWRTSRSCSVRASGGACGDASAGNVAGTRS